MAPKNKKSWPNVTLFILLILTGIGTTTAADVIASPKTIYVDDDFDDDPANHKWNTIQEGLDDARSGDTVYVYAGTYNERPYVKYATVKSLTLQGEDKNTTIINGSVTISISNFTITGFTIKGATGLGDAGIDIWSENNNIIVGNNIFSNYYGIDVGWSSNNNTIKDNNISSNAAEGIWIHDSSGNNITGNTISNNKGPGIEIWDSRNNNITNNTILNNTYGIDTVFTCTGNNITGNNISSNVNSGISIGSSSNNNSITENIISNNGALGGIESSFYTSGNTIANNIISSNKGSGIRMSGVNTVSGNTVFNNSGYGIQFTAGTSNIVTDNIVSGNNGGIGVGYSTNNQITNNTILSSKQYGIHVYGFEKSHFDNLIDTTNTVNGKPVYYYFDESDRVIEGLDTTHLTLAYCSNFTVINSNISNGDGAYLVYSSNNSFNGNEMSSNSVDGIYLLHSHGNSILDSTISSNSDHGIYLDGSDRNDIAGNTVSSNEDGIWLWDYSDNNIIAGNTILSNDEDGVYLRRSNNNTITGNTISNNDFGIYVYYHSDYNLIYNNNFMGNTNQAYDTYYTGTNSWDNGPVDGGNYWSDHTSIGNPSNGSYPYFIGGDANAIDHYPFQDPIDDYGDYGPIITILTDKYEYTTCNTMLITLNFTNLNSKHQTVMFALGINITDFDYFRWLIVRQITIPPGNNSITIPLHVGNWGSKAFNTSWYAVLANSTTYEIISEDRADWRYLPSVSEAMPEMPEKIAGEIAKTLKVTI